MISWWIFAVYFVLYLSVQCVKCFSILWQRRRPRRRHLQREEERERTDKEKEISRPKKGNSTKKKQKNLIEIHFQGFEIRVCVCSLSVCMCVCGMHTLCIWFNYYLDFLSNKWIILTSLKRIDWTWRTTKRTKKKKFVRQRLNLIAAKKTIDTCVYGWKTEWQMLAVFQLFIPIECFFFSCSLWLNLRH